MGEFAQDAAPQNADSIRNARPIVPNAAALLAAAYSGSEETMRGVVPPDQAAATGTVSTKPSGTDTLLRYVAPGGQSYDVDHHVSPDGRSYDLYKPPGLKFPAGLAIGADGLVSADKDAAFEMGILNGLFKEANQDKNHIVLILNPKAEMDGVWWHGNYKFFTAPHSAVGYFPEIKDTQYFLNSFAEVKALYRIDTNKVLCEGLSTGAQFLRSMDEEREGVPRDPPCKTIAMFSSGSNEDEPPIKPGVSELFTFTERSGEFKNGKLDLTTEGGWAAALYDDWVRRAKLWHNIPERLWTDAILANHLDPSRAVTIPGPYFDKTTLTSSDGKTITTRFDIHRPYVGHYFPGAPSAKFGNPPSDWMLSGHHIAACAAGLGTHCDSDGFVP